MVIVTAPERDSIPGRCATRKAANGTARGCPAARPIPSKWQFPTNLVPLFAIDG
jgi:hypothetical protein